eukprot:4627843-Amphidinium_carterae.1
MFLEEVNIMSLAVAIAWILSQVDQMCCNGTVGLPAHAGKGAQILVLGMGKDAIVAASVLPARVGSKSCLLLGPKCTA